MLLMAPARYGRDRDRSVPVASCYGRQDVGLDPEPGEEGAAIFYRQVLKINEPWLRDITSVRQSKRMPGVLTVTEVRAVRARVNGTTGLMLRLLYGSGLRLRKCERLRVKDVDFGQMQIVVRDG